MASLCFELDNFIWQHSIVHAASSLGYQLIEWFNKMIIVIHFQFDVLIYKQFMPDHVAWIEICGSPILIWNESQSILKYTLLLMRSNLGLRLDIGNPTICCIQIHSGLWDMDITKRRLLNISGPWGLIKTQTSSTRHFLDLLYMISKMEVTWPCRSLEERGQAASISQVMSSISNKTKSLKSCKMGELKSFICRCPLTGIFVSRGKITGRIRKIGNKILKISHF